MRDLYRELLEPQEPQRPVYKHWHFMGKPGSIIVGRVVGFTTNHYTLHRNGVLVLTDEGEELRVTADPSDLREQLTELAVREGDRIGIKYIGPDYKAHRNRFRVLVDREEDGYDDDEYYRDLWRWPPGFGATGRKESNT